LSVDDDLSFLQEFEHMTLARLHISRCRTDGAGHAVRAIVGLLDRLLRAAEESERMGSVIEILVLAALAF
jgi:LuxR family transcriptional regulator, maltose regulon positive regulatory protein